MTLEFKDKDLLISAWITLHYSEEESKSYKDNLWAEFELSRLTNDDPEKCWELILEILKRDNSPKILQGLSAGVLEDLLGLYGEEFINRIEEQASKNSSFRSLLGGVWQGDMSDDVWERVQMAAGEKW